MPYDIIHDEVERISNIVCRPCASLILKHNIKVATKLDDGRRNYFHSEYKYRSNTYTDRNYSVSMKLSYFSYLSLEEVNKDWNEKESIMITSSSMYDFVKGFKTAKKWFTKEKFKKLYLYDNNRLILNAEFNDLESIITNLPANKTIRIIPDIIDVEGEDVEGIRIYLNSNNNIYNMTFSQLLNFYHIIKKFDLYLSSQTLINYIGRPESGHFMSELDNNVSQAKSFTSSKGISKYRKTDSDYDGL